MGMRAGGSFAGQQPASDSRRVRISRWSIFYRCDEIPKAGVERVGDTPDGYPPRVRHAALDPGECRDGDASAAGNLFLGGAAVLPQLTQRSCERLVGGIVRGAHMCLGRSRHACVPQEQHATGRSLRLDSTDNLCVRSRELRFNDYRVEFLTVSPRLRWSSRRRWASIS